MRRAGDPVVRGWFVAKCVVGTGLAPAHEKANRKSWTSSIDTGGRINSPPRKNGTTGVTASSRRWIFHVLPRAYLEDRAPRRPVLRNMRPAMQMLVFGRRVTVLSPVLLSRPSRDRSTTLCGNILPPACSSIRYSGLRCNCSFCAASLISSPRNETADRATPRAAIWGLEELPTRRPSVRL